MKLFMIFMIFLICLYINYKFADTTTIEGFDKDMFAGIFSAAVVGFLIVVLVVGMISPKSFENKAPVGRPSLFSLNTSNAPRINK